MSTGHATQGLPDGVAIIGMAGRFPGASHLRQYWHNLCQGVESIVFLSDEELAAAGVPERVRSDPSYVRAAARLADIEWFDAPFFGYSAKEASLMDPQQRLFLECAWEALEEAGYAPNACPGAVGVFAGAGANGYVTSYAQRIGNLDGDVLAAFLANAADFMATRVSYKLNLRGPSLTVQTACSTSLVAVHLACQSLLHGECDMALAGGASIKVTEIPGYFHQPGGIAAPDGHCRAFDAQARGTLFGDGVGVVILKRAAEAIAARDHVYAVIRGSAINNDGASKVGYTAPSVTGQARVVEEAVAVAGVAVDSIGYVETHGTGTALGDPVEIAALTQAFRTDTDRRQFCALGSVKTNIGHLDAAAGIASLIKATLMLHYRTLPPSLHFAQPNPEIDFAASPFFVNTERREWPASGDARRAGVSSFGMGGTNAHLILEEGPEATRPTGAPDRPLHLLTLSARTESALLALAGRYAQYLAAHPEMTFADICYTANTGRAQWPHRLAVVAASAADASAKLSDFVAGRHEAVLAGGSEVSARPRIGFVFADEGGGAAAGWQQLYDTQPTFAAAFDRGTSGAAASGAGTARPVSEMVTVAAVEYALSELWRSWGIRPAAVIGRGAGEYVAGCVAGVFSPEDAMRFIASPSVHGVSCERPHTALVCPATGRFLDAGESSSVQYWGRRPRPHAGFDAGLETMLGAVDLLVEIGPAAWRESERDVRPAAQPAAGAWQRVLSTLGTLFVRGAAIDWAGVDRDFVRHRVSLPTYPFERKRYWLDAAERHGAAAVPASDAAPASAAESTAFRVRIDSASPGQRVDLLIAFVQGEVANVLGLESPAGIDPQRGFFDLGLESLTALALRGRLERGLRCQLPTSFAMNYPTVERLARHLVEVLGLEALPSADAAAPAQDGDDAGTSGLDGLSEEELATLLDEQVGQVLGVATDEGAR